MLSGSGESPARTGCPLTGYERHHNEGEWLRIRSIFFPIFPSESLRSPLPAVRSALLLQLPLRWPSSGSGPLKNWALFCICRVDGGSGRRTASVPEGSKADSKTLPSPRPSLVGWRRRESVPVMTNFIPSQILDRLSSWVGDWFALIRLTLSHHSGSPGQHHVRTLGPSSGHFQMDGRSSLGTALDPES